MSEILQRIFKKKIMSTHVSSLIGAVQQILILFFYHNCFIHKYIHFMDFRRVLDLCKNLEPLTYLSCKCFDATTVCFSLVVNCKVKEQLLSKTCLAGWVLLSQKRERSFMHKCTTSTWATLCVDIHFTIAAQCSLILGEYLWSF